MSAWHFGQGAADSAMADGSIAALSLTGIKNSCRTSSPCVNQSNRHAEVAAERREATGLRTMSIDAIDCDVHPTVTGNEVLLPYLETYWRDSVVERGMGSLESASYPPMAPISARPDFRGKNGYAATDV